MRQSSLAARLTPLVTSLAAIVSALILGGIFLALRGKDPIAAFTLLFSRGLGTSYGITETLIHVAPLLIVSAGLLIALRAGVWNIGVDGQLMVGALCAGVASTGSSCWPRSWRATRRTRSTTPTIDPRTAAAMRC